MSHSLYPLVKFSGGEWSPSMDNRYDAEGYRDALRLGRNVIPTKQGGAIRRPGSQFIATGKVSASGAPSVSSMRKFQFAPGTTFSLEFCDLGIRFYSNGSQVTLPTASMTAWVTGTTYAAGSFASSLGKGYYLYSGSNGPGTPLINSTVIPSIDTAHWSNQNVYEVPAPYSGTGATSYTAFGVPVITPFTLPNYWTADVCNVVIQEINDVVYIIHPNFPVWKLTRFGNTNWVSQQVQFLTPAMLDENATDLSLTAGATSGNTSLVATAGGAWTAGSTYYVPGNSVTGGGSFTANIYQCIQAHTSGVFATDLANGYWQPIVVFQPQHVGSYWLLAYNRPYSYIEFDAVASGTNYTFAAGTWFNQTTGGTGGASTIYLIGTWEVQTYGTWQGNVTISVSYDNGTTFQTVTTLSSKGDANFSITGQELDGGIYKFTVINPAALASTTPPRVVLSADNQFVYGLVQIASVSSTLPYNANVNVIVPLYSTAATIFWSEGAWSQVRGYPQAITVFQERVWYAGTASQPQTVWATQTDDIEDFALVDQSQATYGLSFTLNAPGRGPILWMAAQTDLFAGLASAEWILSSGGATTAITPSQIQALEHTVKGSAPSIPGLIIDQACVFLQRKGRVFFEEQFSVFTNKYMASELNTTSAHLTNAGVVQFDFQQQFENQAIIWAVCGDGTLISFTYAKEQKVYAWAGHNTGTDQNDKIISVSVIAGANGQDDEVWISVIRTAVSGPVTNNGCQIERLYPIDWQTANLGQPQLNQAVYADGATIVTSPGSNFITNLPFFLINRPVAISICPASEYGMWAIRNVTCANGIPQGNGGTVTIPNYVPVAGDTVVIGLAIQWKIQPMRLDADPRAGPTTGLLKSIQRLYLRVVNSIGGQWSTLGIPPVGGQLSAFYDIQVYPIQENSNLPPPFTPNIPTDIVLEVGGRFGNSLDPQFAVVGSDPLPFYLLGILVQYDIASTP